MPLVVDSIVSGVVFWILRGTLFLQCILQHLDRHLRSIDGTTVNVRMRIEGFGPGATRTVTLNLFKDYFEGLNRRLVALLISLQTGCME